MSLYDDVIKAISNYAYESAKKAVSEEPVRKIPGTITRRWYYKVKWQDDYTFAHHSRQETYDIGAVEGVSSQTRYNYPTETQLHAPVLDFDFPVEVVPSTTPGHHHVYLDKVMTWRQYKRVLRAMMRAGLIEKGYYETSVKHGYTTVRAPWVKKDI